jgi:flagellar capping protein FliD
MLPDQIDYMSTQIIRLDDRMDKLEALIEDRLKEIDAQLSKIDSRLDKLEKDLEVLNTTMYGLTSSLQRQIDDVL